MPSPTTVAEFVELVRKSGVVDEKRLDAHLEKLRAASALPSQPGQLAGVLIRDGVLTRFQAEQFLQGKYKNFTIGKYRVLEQLGSGGMGSVYLCEHMLMRRRVAVKVLPKNKAEDPAALDRFYREARAVAALDHPNIVRAYDIDQAAKLHFLVMEYVDGASLQEIIKRTGPMEVTRACHYIRQAALGLQHAHEAAGLVHRDIKPGNILVDRNGIVKVLDMGLARFFHDDEDNITKKYDESVLGTADYLAPEQAVDSHDADIRADIYSLGATFYFCLTGRTPFQEGTVAQKLIWHQTRQPKPIRQIRTDVDESLVAVLEKMMAKRRDDRYQTPLAVVEALAPWTKTQIPPPPETEMPRLCLAATSGMPGSSGSGPTPTGSDSGVRTNAKPGAAPSPAPRKSWQVSGGAPAPSQPATERPSPPKSPPSEPQAKAVPAAAPATVPAVRPTPPGATPGPGARPTPAALPAPAPVPRGAPSPNAIRPAAASVLPAPAPTKTAIAPPPAAVPAPPEEVAPWERLAGDTNDATSQFDTDRAAGGRARLDQSREAAQARRRLFVVLGIIGGVVLVLIVLGVWLALRGKSSDTGKKTEPEATIHHVGRDGDFNTIAEALDHAKSGDRIVVQADSVREWLQLAPSRGLKNIVVEAADPKKKVIWRPPTGPGPLPLIQLNDAEGIHFKGFKFDGEGRVKTLVHLCTCRDIRLDDIELTGFTESGVRFTNCGPRPKQRIVLNRVSANSDKPPLFFEVLRAYTPQTNANITVEDTCSFTGGGIVIKKEFKVGDNDRVELPSGMKFQTIPPGK